MIKLILTLPIFPVLLLFDALHIKKLKIGSIILNIFKLLLALFVFFPTWGLTYFYTGVILADKYGFIAEKIPLSGTGSMYPTFPKGTKKTISELSQELVAKPYMLPFPNGISLFDKRYFSYQLKRGDIIQFENNKVFELTKKISGKEAGMVKRIIALPHDTVEIKDGLLILNNSEVKEPYIARPHSTFGGTFLHECQKITIPDNKIFVMGDNRKSSSDSRYELGLIDFKDVRYVLPLENQKGIYDKNWRDTTADLDNSSKIKLDEEKYLSLLNEKRASSQVNLLKHQPQLDESARKRAEVILKYNDFSFEATKSGYTMTKAMNESGYSNIIWGETPINGYYEADELIDNQFEFPDTRQFLLNKNYQDFGMAEVEGSINNCPTQIIVQQYAGYIPPNYKKSDIEIWRKLLNNLVEIQPGWKSLEKHEDFYKKNKIDTDRINEIIQIRITNVNKILKRMLDNQWLNNDEENYVNNLEQKLAAEQEQLSEKLNK